MITQIFATVNLSNIFVVDTKFAANVIFPFKSPYFSYLASYLMYISIYNRNAHEPYIELSNLPSVLARITRLSVNTGVSSFKYLFPLLCDGNSHFMIMLRIHVNFKY